jgi:FHA domain-containing protein
MPLVIRARSQHDAASSLAIVCTFDGRGGTIGRSDASTLTLPDPARHVSRVQGLILFDQGTYAIKNVGSSNPVVINGWPMRTGEEAQLFHGDLLTIGQYLLTVDMTDMAAAPAITAQETPQIPARSMGTQPKVITPSEMLTTVTMPTPQARPVARNDSECAAPPQRRLKNQSRV